jgi:hypothetical protein
MAALYEIPTETHPALGTQEQEEVSDLIAA